MLWLFLSFLAGCGRDGRKSERPAEPTGVSTRLDPERRYIRSFEKDRQRLTDPSLRKRYNLTPTEERELRRELAKKRTAVSRGATVTTE